MQMAWQYFPSIPCSPETHDDGKKVTASASWQEITEAVAK